MGTDLHIRLKVTNPAPLGSKTQITTSELSENQRLSEKVYFQGNCMDGVHWFAKPAAQLVARVVQSLLRCQVDGFCNHVMLLRSWCNSLALACSLLIDNQAP